MGHASYSLAIKASAAATWDYVGDFNGLPRWHPAVKASTLEEGGQVRRLTLQDGAEIVERLLGRDDGLRSYNYSITQSPLPIKRYSATIRVSATPDGSQVDWNGEFESAGPPDADVAAIFQQIYSGGLDNLKILLEQKST
jgi:Polyketide cyclase / dehydrase and lipid transport